MRPESAETIIEWLTSYATTASCEGFVVGVSGGVDSALTSTLCALTGKTVVVVGMPIDQEAGQLSRSQNQPHPSPQLTKESGRGAAQGYLLPHLHGLDIQWDSFFLTSRFSLIPMI